MMTQTMVDTKVITTAVELACRAPSLHNSQPWRWVASSTSVDLFVDPHRTVTSTDKSGREADHQLWRRARSLPGRDGRRRLGHERRTVSQSEQSRPPRLDRLRFGRLRRAGPARPRRCDTASPDQPTTVPCAEATGGRSNPYCAARSTSDLVTLDVLADDARPRLAEASRLTEALRRYDDLYHHELLWWTAPLRESEGIPESALSQRRTAAEST